MIQLSLASVSSSRTKLNEMNRLNRRVDHQEDVVGLVSPTEFVGFSTIAFQGVVQSA